MRLTDVIGNVSMPPPSRTNGIGRAHKQQDRNKSVFLPHIAEPPVFARSVKIGKQRMARAPLTRRLETPMLTGMLGVGTKTEF